MPVRSTRAALMVSAAAAAASSVALCAFRRATLSVVCARPRSVAIEVVASISAA